MKTAIKSSLLLISIFFPPEFGGGAAGAWSRAKALDKLGYSVFVICGFPSFPTGKVSDAKYKGKYFCVETLESFTVIRLRLFPFAHDGFVKRFMIFANFILLSILYMPKILRITGKIDITYARAPILFSSFIGFVYSVFTKSFFIYEAPDFWPEQLIVEKTHLLSIIMWFGKILANLSYAYADVIITIGDYAAHYISKEYKPRSAVYGLPIGVDISKFPILSKDISKEELIEKKIFPSELRNKFIILYSGSISPQQRVDSLAYAANKLKNEKEIAFLIIGEGREKQKLEQLKLEHTLDNFYLLPSQPRNLMPTILSAVDVCTVLLSPEPIFQMALPSKFYECIASNKPLIAVCEGELADIINTNKIGRTVNYGDIDGLSSIIKDFKDSPSLIQTMKNNCANTLQKFSSDAIASKLQKILGKELKINHVK
jgi:glycosyltransferase involved in cell wall biosynthesis